VVKTFLKIAVCVWLVRWLAGEIAAYAGRHWRKHGPPPIESERAPGWMPPPRTRDHAGNGAVR
jgi:hypothetical protein